MNDLPMPAVRRKKGGKLIPALCNIFGTLILVVTIASCLPIIIPRLMGYSVYNVVSGSMAPEIPTGSVIYVSYTSPELIAAGDVIAFESGGGVIAHRVVRNQMVEGKFITKGDANEAEDVNPVNYGAVIGRVTSHFPFFGGLMELYTSDIVKLYLFLFASCGAMLNLLASRLREHHAQQE